MPNSARPALEDEQPRRVAPLRRMLRDQLLREVVVEFVDAHPTESLFSRPMEQETVERAMRRVADAAEGRTQPAELEAALERARASVESLAAATAELEAGLPDKVGAAVREGLGSEARPVARNVAEVRGLMNQVLRRLERLEGDVLAERHARIDDLAVLVDLIASGWKSVDDRLANFERHLTAGGDAVVYRIEERRAGTPS